MTSREIIKRIIVHDHPPRIGFNFQGDNPKDMLHVPAAVMIRPDDLEVEKWGRDPALTAQVPGFPGEVKLTIFGSIRGRLNQKTNGECIKGVLQESWDLLETLVYPVIDENKDREFENAGWNQSDKYVLANMPISFWSTLFNTRGIAQILMDLILEPGYVKKFLEKINNLQIMIVDRACKNGANAIMILDDLGTQQALFFSPEIFKEIFKPFYKKLSDEVHSRGMKLFMHSCGNVYKIVPELIDSGIDVFQFDQPELTGSKIWAEEFGDRAAFYCPVDIQKIMNTGDERIIREGALEMVNNFKKCGGSLIAMDYPNWNDINVLPQWQQWARDTIIANADI